MNSSRIGNSWLLLALLALFSTPALAQEAPAPKLVWQRPIELPTVEREERVDGSAFGVLAMVARPDGGVVIAAVEDRKGRKNTLEALRVVAVDGAGKDLWTRKLAVPGGSNGNARMRSAAIEASDPARVWVFQAWSTRDDVDAGASRIVGLNRNGGMEIAVANGRPRFVASSERHMVVREAVRLVRLSDASLLAVGTHYFGPPQWWYARYDKAGKMLWERGSKGFPDYVEDAWPQPDGGASLLMVDAENRSERPIFRRIAADGRQLEQHDLVELSQQVGCTALIGLRRQVRAIVDFDVKAQRIRKTEIVWHEQGRGVTHRIDIGPRGCGRIVRDGSAAIYFDSSVWDKDAKGLVLALTSDGAVRWRLELPGSLDVAPTSDGGAIVLQEIEEEGKAARLVLTRYAAP